jgi:hypothetical protein
MLQCATCLVMIPTQTHDLGRGAIAVRVLAPVWPLQLGDGKRVISTVHCSDACARAQIQKIANTIRNQ